MFIYGKRRLTVQEVLSSSVTNRGPLDITNINLYELEFSYWKLCFAIAKTTVSRNISDLNLLLDTLANIFRFSFLINSSRDIITLEKWHFGNLRDFTRTNRTGEIAQGLTYLLAQEQLNFRSVIDFEGFINLNGGIIPAKTSTPDFIMQNAVLDYNIALIESKGSYPEKSDLLKSSLKKALKQCNSGEAILNGFNRRYIITNKYAFHVKFENELSTRNTTSYIADPETLPQSTEKNLHIIRYHYAAWFMLMGDFDNALRLSTNNAPVVDYQLLGNDEYYHGNVGVSFPVINPSQFRISIPKDVIFLLSGDSEKIVDYKPIDTDQLIQYVDGVRLMRYHN